MESHKIFPTNLGPWKGCAGSGSSSSNHRPSSSSLHTHTLSQLYQGRLGPRTRNSLPDRDNHSGRGRCDPWWAASIVIIEFAVTVIDFHAFLASLHTSPALNPQIPARTHKVSLCPYWMWCLNSQQLSLRLHYISFQLFAADRINCEEEISVAVLQLEARLQNV